MDTDIEPICNQVAHPVTDMHLQRKLRISVEERGQDGSKHVMPETAVYVDAQAAADFSACSGCPCCGVLDAGQVRRNLLVEAPAFIGQGNGSSISVKDADTDTLLEASNRSTYSRLRQSNGFTSAFEAARFNYSRKNSDPVQKAAVKDHVSCLMSSTEIRCSNMFGAPEPHASHCMQSITARQ
ncbi:hypothetical protein GCM10016234_18800 [Tianweitania populi]|uniref:Uncharacterized protein n=1 Tax=Tianweitania populi TaxID=1607949 RepID=A0A8J3DPY1_9HYPH|nr:hypothetical protein GCM10016234_18800 [Tianweitania populi]